MRRVLVAVALLALLLPATFGNVLHHHTGSSAQNCSICHAIHQPFERPQGDQRGLVAELVAASPAPQELAFSPDPVSTRLSSRAPPTA